MKSLRPWCSEETGVDGHDDGGQGHEDGTDSRAHDEPDACKHTCRQWNGDDIVPGGLGQVLQHFAIRSAREPHNCHDVARIVANQDNVCRLDGNVGTSTDRNPHIGLCECWSIVHTISDHRYCESPLLDFLDLGCLLVWQDFGEEII